MKTGLSFFNIKKNTKIFFEQRLWTTKSCIRNDTFNITIYEIKLRYIAFHIRYASIWYEWHVRLNLKIVSLFWRFSFLLFKLIYQQYIIVFQHIASVYNKSWLYNYVILIITVQFMLLSFQIFAVIFAFLIRSKDRQLWRTHCPILCKCLPLDAPATK